MLECGSGEQGTFHLSVTDDGPGIPDELQSKVFEPFDRLGAEASNVPGTGIGLTVTRQLIEGMVGNVGFHSKLDEGTTFWIEVPTARADN
ncbi:MAG TPA: ATP-binding protein [Sneathiellales bacterium]|nr:ATP-binding protein [Sneathiellales bacterium]